MPLQHVPKAGQVLVCDFRGYIRPEMVKVRPVVIVSPNHLRHPGLVTVVPLSTTAPDAVQPYHYRLANNPIPGDAATELWAKCDMAATVCLERLDRRKIGRGRYRMGYVSMAQ